MRFDRTFRPGRHSVAAIRSMLSRSGGDIMQLVYVEPKEEKTSTGSRISIGFPALIVPDHVDGAEAFARRVAATLNIAHQLHAELKRCAEHLSTWAADHADEATAETWAALHCAAELIRKADEASA